MEKSFVTLEQQICIVCAQPFDTGSLLLDKRLSKRFDKYTTTGMGLCPEHEKLHKDGYVALVEIDPEKSHAGSKATLQPSEVWRTGTIMHLRRTVARQIFNVDIPDKQPLMFIDEQVTAKIKSMMPEEEGGTS